MVRTKKAGYVRPKRRRIRRGRGTTAAGLPPLSIPTQLDTEMLPDAGPSTSNADSAPDRTQLEDLPNEILVKIFKYLPLEDQRKGRRVSRRWRSNLNTPTFFRDVKLCNAAPLGLRRMERYLKVAVSAETRSLTLSCSRRGAIHVLASIATAKLLADRCPLLEKVTFANGKVPVEFFSILPLSVKLVSFSYVCVVDHRGKVLAVYRNLVQMQNPMVGPDTLYRKLTTPARQLRVDN